MAEKSDDQALKGICMICGRDIEEGIHGHPEVSSEVHEAMGFVVQLGACDHYCCGKTSFLCKAEKLAQHDRERDVAIVEECALHSPVLEYEQDYVGDHHWVRCECGWNKKGGEDAGSWEDHIRSLRPSAPRTLELVRLRARKGAIDKAIELIEGAISQRETLTVLDSESLQMKRQIEELEKQQPEGVNAIRPNLR